MKEFHWARLEALCSETEDPEKVKAALFFISGERPITTERFEGSFGNRILRLRVDLTKSREIENLLSRVASLLTPSDLSRVIDELDWRVDENLHFTLRFDKQEAYLGSLVLSSRDAIQLVVKIAAFPSNRENAKRIISDKLKGFLRKED